MSQVNKCDNCKEGKHHPSEKRDYCGCGCKSCCTLSDAAIDAASAADPAAASAAESAAANSRS